jgi:hypothetical protein
VATTILTVSSNPQTFADGAWPRATMDGGVWRFRFTFSSASGSTYAGYHALFGQPSGGVWIVDSTLRLFTTADVEVFSRSLTWGAGATIVVRLDMAAKSGTISGATSGNGTFTWTTSGPYFSAGSMTAGGVPSTSGYTIAGTFGLVDDGVDGIAADATSYAITGADAALKIGRRATADATSYAWAGQDAYLAAGAPPLPTGVYAWSGADVGLLVGRRLAADPTSYAWSGADATIGPGGVLEYVTSGLDWQPYPYSNRNATITLDTPSSGALAILGVGGRLADTSAVSDSRGNTFSALHAYEAYADFGGSWGVRTWTIRGAGGAAMSGGAGHQFLGTVTPADEHTMAVAVVGGVPAGARITHALAQIGNTGAGGTVTSGSVTVDGKAMLVAFWWGSSPVVPPFSGTGGPGGSGVGAPYTSVPSAGWTVRQSVLVNYQYGEIPMVMATREVSAAGTYSVTWSHTPNQGAITTIVAIQGPRSMVADPTSYAWSGADATPRRGLRVTADATSYAVAGADATLRLGRGLIADPVAFAWTGAAAGALAARRIVADAAVATWSGQDAALSRTRVLIADAASLAIAGSDAGLRATRTLPAAHGAYAWSGADATIYSGARIVADPASYAWGGLDAGLQIARRIAGDAAAIAWSGADAALVVQTASSTVTLTAEPVAYALATLDVVLLRSRRLVADPIVSTWTGYAAALGSVVAASRPWGRGTILLAPALGAVSLAPAVATVEVPVSVSLVAGDLEPDLVVTLLLNGAPVAGLASAQSVSLVWRRPDGTAATVAMTVVDASAAQVRYTWASGDTSIAGTHQARVRVVHADGDPQTFPSDGSWFAWTVAPA